MHKLLTTSFLYLLIVVIVGCTNTPNTSVQHHINQQGRAQGRTYNIYESFDTIPNYQALDARLFQEVVLHPNTILIDVRTFEEFTKNNFSSTAKNIDFDQENFKQKIKQLDTNKIYAVYCQDGIRSKKTLALMKKNKFKESYYLYGGLNDIRK